METGLPEKKLLDEMMSCPELIDGISRSKLPAVINQIAAVVTKAAALQFRIAARLLTETDGQASESVDRFVTVEEAARYLKYRVPYVYQLIRADRLPARREGRRIRIRWADLRSYIRNDPGQSSTKGHMHRGQTNDAVSGILRQYEDRIRGPRRSAVEAESLPGPIHDQAFGSLMPTAIDGEQ